MGEFRGLTERLILRVWRARDWDAFWRVTNTSAVMQWLGGVLDEQGRAATRARVENCARRNGFCFWVIERRSDGAILGFCGLKRADAPNSSIAGEIEIGWRLREDCWGQGYAREAAQAALELAFTRFGAQTVYALTIEENAPSWGLMIRLGMERCEALDYPDPRFEPPWRDTIVYQISREAWRSQAARDDGEDGNGARKQTRF